MIVPPRVKAGVVVPQNGEPEEFERKNADVEAEESPVPPFATAKVPEVTFEALRLVSPDPLPVKVFEPILILPKPLPIEPEVSVPTEARLVALVRPASVVIFGNDVIAARTAIAVVEARELVKKRLFDPSVKSFVLILRDEVATALTAPFVPQSRPFNEPSVVVPVTPKLPPMV